MGLKSSNGVVIHSVYLFNINHKDIIELYDKFFKTAFPKMVELFGTAGKISDKKILSSFNLGYKWKKVTDGEFVKTNTLHTGQVAEMILLLNLKSI